ncbi:MAG TPA: hypothetical protein VIP80_07320 [Gemmatimonadales bacterium]|jgi:hypothetical protein
MAKARPKTKKLSTAKVSIKKQALQQPPSFYGFGTDCSLPRVCEYINRPADPVSGTIGLRAWLAWFWADYKALRIAVCNLEKQVFEAGAGTNAKPPKFCRGGGGTEPADPKDPPNW